MQDDDIKKLFDSFSPGLSSDFDFMKRLERNLDAIEIIKSSNAAFNRRQRRAAFIAAVAGFVAGVVFTFLLPFFGRILGGIDVTVVSNVLHDSDISLLCAILGVASFSLFVAYNSYEISLALMGRSCRKKE